MIGLFKVKCVRGDWGAGLKQDQEYIVAVVVEKGIDYRGIVMNGYILTPESFPCNNPWPYVWDKDRFEILN